MSEAPTPQVSGEPRVVETSKGPVLVIDHPMRAIMIDKVVVNIALGQSGERLHKVAKILESITGQRPSLRKAKRTIKEFGIRKGEPIACMVTLRGRRAYEFLKKALEAIGNVVKVSSFDRFGNLSFGIREYITIPGVKYDPTVGMFGMDVVVALARPGFRVARRRRRRGTVPMRHRVTRDEAILFFKYVFGTRVLEE